MRMVLLRHTLPDGTGHFDWMFERDSSPSDADSPSLISFRVPERIDLPEFPRFTCVRIQDHRRAYLDFEGEVSGGRGQVQRIASGDVERVLETPANIEITGRLGQTRGRWTGTKRDDVWDFQRQP